MSWQPLEQGLIGKRQVGMVRRVSLSPGQAEQDIVNGLIMDIFNIFIAQKLKFEKRDMPPMDLGVKVKDQLFLYSIDGGRMHLIAMGVRKKKELLAVDLVLVPAQVALSEQGKSMMALLDGISDNYVRR
jgi:hypothetical protein